MSKLKALTAMALAALLCFCAAASFAAGETPRFSDTKGHWAEMIIGEAASMGIMEGYPGAVFKPDALMTREEFFSALAGSLTSSPAPPGGEAPFTDIIPGAWYEDSIKIMALTGAAQGYADGSFGVGGLITREEAAKAVASLIPPGGAQGAGASLAKDAPEISAWARPYVDKLFDKGYIKGDDLGRFNPKSSIKRCEAAVMLVSVKKNEQVIGANADEQPGGARGNEPLANVFTKGAGTRTAPYEISSEDQLNRLREYADESGAFYTLKSDIVIKSDFATAPGIDFDWSGGNFEPIGNAEKPFLGNFDGGGYTVSGLRISLSSSGGAPSYGGLFGCVGEGASVINLNIDDSVIEGSDYSGTIAGYNEGTITNCRSWYGARVSAVNSAGGLVGRSARHLSMLANYGSVSGANAGGITGLAEALGVMMTNCANYGSVSGALCGGGIAGSVTSAAKASLIKDCANGGEVSGDGFSGGIIGAVNAAPFDITLDGARNTGAVSGNISGGIAGVLNEGAVIKSCSSGALIKGDFAGGLAGMNAGSISLSSNAGEVSAEKAGGGAAGLQILGAYLESCYNEAPVSGGDAGGLAGVNEGLIRGCYNTGAVEGRVSAGGAAGNNSGEIRSVYGTAEISGSGTAGALAGLNSGVIDTAFWIGGEGMPASGKREGTAARDVKTARLTDKQMSGQEKIMLTDSYELATSLLNEGAQGGDIWIYTYYTLTAAPSDRPSAVDSRGNVIAQKDLDNSYIYPQISGNLRV